MHCFNPIQILKSNLDQGCLKYFITNAIVEVGMNVRRTPPTKDEVLDYLFSKNRYDPEAIYLAKRISPMILRYLAQRKKG